MRPNRKLTDKSALKPHEIEVLRLAAMSLSNEQIAKKVARAPKTVEHMLSMIPHEGSIQKYMPVIGRKPYYGTSPNLARLRLKRS